jgi:L-amino acid N-acyltransferase YncA
MNINLAPITWRDCEPVIDIFNYYVENTFAAYPEQGVTYKFFDVLLNMCQDYPAATAKDGEGNVVGFGMLRPYHPASVFASTAEITYFVKPDFIGKGIGKTLLEFLVAGGREKNLLSILASVSSLNEVSIAFHLRNGFAECGRFRSIGRKRGRTFDVVYFQRML